MSMGEQAEIDEQKDTDDELKIEREAEREDERTRQRNGKPKELIPYADAIDKGPVATLASLPPMPQQMSLYAIATQVAASGYFPDARQTAQAMVKILYGAELGIAPISSIMGIYLVNGKPAYTANIMAAAVAKSPRHKYRIRKLTNQECVLEFFVDGESVGSSEFTLDDAKIAGLAGKDVWKRYPRNMLLARAISNGFRWFCADLTGGSASYTPEELGLAVDADTGEIIEVQSFASIPVQEPTTQAKTTKPTGKVKVAQFEDEVEEGDATPLDSADVEQPEDEDVPDLLPS